MMKKYCFALVLIFFSCWVFSQDQDSILIRRIFDEALTSRVAYENLRYLCKNTKGRICGTPEAAAAVEFMRQVMLGMDLDSVYLQEVMVKRWVRGEIEYALATSGKLGSLELAVTALGTSVGTGEIGITGYVIEVKDFEELKNLGENKVNGKIVFFNRPMDPTLINTFTAYGGVADQRVGGAAEAGKYGAKGVIVRSLTTSIDDFPHTGVMIYQDGIPRIPAVCVSTMGANNLSDMLRSDPDLQLNIITSCENLPEVISYNVIGEIRGSENPEQIITLGGHLDAWDTGEGAHDDGAGCIHAVEALRIYRELGIRPKRTIRAVLFMDEEVAQRGAKKYAEMAASHNESHYAALESDRGGFMPRGFGFSASGERLKSLLELEKYFTPYEITEFTSGGGGADIGPLRQFGTLLISFVPDMQRYFDYHHSPNDTFEQVNIRELQLGSAAIAALVYLIDKFDL